MPRYALALALVTVPWLGCSGSGKEETIQPISQEEREKRLEQLTPQQRRLIEGMSGAQAQAARQAAQTDAAPAR